MTDEQIKAVIDANSHPELAQERGMVWQVWEDGEITLQKCGPLLWQRSLHMITPGLGRSVSPLLFPHRYNDDSHGYIFTTEEGAKAVREAIAS